MELDDFSQEVGRIFANPGSLTRRQGAEFSARLHRFLHLQRPGGCQQSRITLWNVTEGAEEVSQLCPQAQFMRIFEQVLTLGLDQMRRDLLNAFSGEAAGETSGQWQTLEAQFLQPMSRLVTFSRVMRACMSPMRSWLDTSVFIGHRTLHLADQIRQCCLVQFLKHVAAPVSAAIFRTLHHSEHQWSSSDLEPVLQYVRILHQYQRFQAYLSRAGQINVPYDSWEDACHETGGAELFSLTGVFVEPYLDCLRQFYRPMLQPFDAHLVARSVGDWLTKEENLAVECNIEGFRDAAVNCLLQETVRSHLEAFGEAVRQLMRQNDSQGLSLFFRVMVMVDGGLDHLLDVLRGFVKDQMLQMFDGIRIEFEPLDPNSAKATSMYINGCVAQMRFCKAMIDATELQTSLSRNLLMGTVKTGIADVLNSNPLVDAIRHPASYPAAALAHHFHRQLRAFRALESDGREVISDLMTLYSLLVDKEAFLMRYHALLRERLLSDGCDHLSLDAEDFALENFTQLSGWKAVYEVKSVLKDFKESEEFNGELRNLPEYQGLQRNLFGGVIPIKFTFVRGYFWRMTADKVNLPPELAPIVNSAISAYQSNRTGRVVTFAHSYGSGLLAFAPLQSLASSDAAVMLRCSTAVMILLLNFNESDSLSRAALQARSGFSPSDLNFFLHHLVRAGVLVNNEGDDNFTVNDDFRSSAKLVNLMVSQQQHSQKQRRRLEKLDERMKEKRVQCAVVSVMKQLRHLTRTNLFQMVQSRLPHSTLHASFFSEQLTYLISGGYIRVANEAAEDTEESVVEYIP